MSRGPAPPDRSRLIQGPTPLRALAQDPCEEVKAIVARHHGRSVALIGSVARGDDHAGSDVDLLVELEPGTRPFEILLLGAELEDALGLKVDVATPDSLRARMRDEVLADAVPL